MRIAAQVAVVLASLWIVSGTAMNLSRHPHWYTRGWDFPRPVIVALAAACGWLYAAHFYTGAWYDAALVAALGAAALWQLVNIFPYTPLAPRSVKAARRRDPESRFRLVISNVLEENRDFERWLGVISAPPGGLRPLPRADRAEPRAGGRGRAAPPAPGCGRRPRGGRAHRAR